MPAEKFRSLEATRSQYFHRPKDRSAVKTISSISRAVRCLTDEREVGRSSARVDTPKRFRKFALEGIDDRAVLPLTTDRSSTLQLSRPNVPFPRHPEPLSLPRDERAGFSRIFVLSSCLQESFALGRPRTTLDETRFFTSVLIAPENNDNTPVS